MARQLRRFLTSSGAELADSPSASPEQHQTKEETPRWERRGRCAGLAAGIQASYGRDFTITPPTAVKEEAGDAEEQWRSGFEKAFEIQTKKAINEAGQARRRRRAARRQARQGRAQA